MTNEEVLKVNFDDFIWVCRNGFKYPFMIKVFGIFKYKGHTQFKGISDEYHFPEEKDRIYNQTECFLTRSEAYKFQIKKTKEEIRMLELDIKHFEKYI